MFYGIEQSTDQRRPRTVVKKFASQSALMRWMAKARAYLETGGWTPVEDGLPVVPEGSEYVEIFFFCAAPGGRVGRRLWLDIDATVAHGITHWRYAEPTPEPPKG